MLRKKRLAGSSKYLRNRCQVCKNVVETGTFQSFVNKKADKINHRFTCRDKCLVYLISCKVCERQYTCQTVDEFRYRWNNYKNNNRESLRGGVNISKLSFCTFPKSRPQQFPRRY